MVSTGMFVLTVAVCLAGGFHQGYIASVLNQPYVVIEDYINTSWIERTSEPIAPNTLNILWASLNIVFPASAIVGQFLAAYLCGRIGRKRSAILATSLYVPGIALSFSAKYFHPVFELLFIGRIIWSLANGINTVNATVWIVECAPAKHRGRMAALQEVFMACGSLMSQAVGVPFSTDDLWPNVFVPPLIVSAITVTIFCLTWESPQYIIDHEHDMAKARHALAFYHGKKYDCPSLDAELKVCEESLLKKNSEEDEREREILETNNNKKKIRFEHDGVVIMFNPVKANDPVSRVIRHGAWVGVMVKIAYVFTGARCLRAYSTFVLHHLARWPLGDALYGSFFIGLLRLPFTLVPVLLVDRLGRRPLILVSMFASLLAQLLIMMSIANEEPWKMGTLLGLASLLLVNACGLGSVSRFYSAELVPRHLLLKSVSLLTMFEALMKISLEFSFYPVANINGALSMLLFVCPTALFMVLAWYLCPETSGRNVNEVLNKIADLRKISVKFDA